MLQKVVMIDPPEGWKYGFPKPFPVPTLTKPVPKDLHDWLIENGYPEDLIREMGDRFVYQTWEEWV